MVVHCNIAVYWMGTYTEWSQLITITFTIDTEVFHMYNLPLECNFPHQIIINIHIKYDTYTYYQDIIKDIIGKIAML